MLTILCLLGMIALTACGTNSSNSNEGSEEPVAQANEQTRTPGSEQNNEQSNDQSEEQKVFEQNFGEPFHYEIGSSKVMITLADPEIVKERHGEDRLKDETDYIKVFVQVENVGDDNSSDNVIGSGSFKAYNSNGVEISKQIAFAHFDIRYVEGEFEAAELRPNGKNEGHLYIPIKEDAIPAEIIFYESTNDMFIQYSRQYVFKL